MEQNNFSSKILRNILVTVFMLSAAVEAQTQDDSISSLKKGIQNYLSATECNDGLLQVLEQKCDPAEVPTPQKGPNELHCIAMAMTAQQVLNDIKQTKDLVAEFKNIHCADQQCFNNIGSGGFTQFDSALSTALNMYRPRAQGLLNRITSNNHSYNSNTNKFVYSTGPSTFINISTTGQDMVSRYTANRIQGVQNLYSCNAQIAQPQVAAGTDGSPGGAPPSGGSSFQGDGHSSRQPASVQAKPIVTVAGLSIIDGKGGRIGVAADNLFNMIHRCYSEERKQDKFIHEK